MPNDHSARHYREIEVKTASPTELVVLLYDAAIASISQAQKNLAAGDITGRVRCINKATAILTELQANLNFDAGGEIARSLDRLYNYIIGRVFQANLDQDEGPLSESVRLLGGLRSAWIQVAQGEGDARRKSAGDSTAAHGTNPAPPGSREGRTASSFTVTG